MSRLQKSSTMQFSGWLVHQAGALLKQGVAVLVMGVCMYWTGVDVISGQLPPGDFVAIAAYVAQVTLHLRVLFLVRFTECWCSDCNSLDLPSRLAGLSSARFT